MRPRQTNLLAINVLGEFKLSHAGAVITTVTSIRQQALITYMALHADAPQPRQQVAFQLWPDSSEPQAKHNLRKTLYQLRQAFPPIEEYWQIDSRTIRWRSETPSTVDVVNFEQKLAQASVLTANPTAQQVCLTEALACYGGDLLPACYDDWIVPERERLQRLYQNGLAQAAQVAEDQRDYLTAIHYADQLLRLDPLHEAVYGRLMRLHMRNQDRAAALQTYQRCVAKLQQELGVEPGAALRNMHSELLQPEQLVAVRPTTTRADQRLVGRQNEWQALAAAWQQTARAHVQLCVLSGEAGIGKTHLAEEMLTWAAQQGVITATAHLFEAAASLVYTPVVDWLRAPSLQKALLNVDKIWLSQLSRLLPEILIEHPDLPAPPPTSDQWQRRQLFEALTRVFQQDDRPKLLLVDDLQWCDRETLDWLRYLLSIANRAHDADHAKHPLLILATVRREELDAEHPLTQWLLELRSTQQITEIALTPLDLDATGQLAAQESHLALNAEQVDNIYHLTGGNPLFVVEMVRAGLDGHDEHVPGAKPHLPFPLDQTTGESTQLPPKVQAVIQARLGRLSPLAHHIANVAATIGREFSFELLQQIRGEDEAELTAALDELWRRGIIRVRGIQRYDFSHARIREVVYAELSPIQKPLLHRQVAQALETIHVGDLAAVSAQLAGHYEKAGAIAEAITYYQRAADVSHALFAAKDAVAFLRRAMAMLETLPVTRTSKQQELALLLQLTAPLTNAYGLLTPELPRIAEKARQLAIEVGTSTQLYFALGSLQMASQMRGQFAQAQAIIEERHALAAQWSAQGSQTFDSDTPPPLLDHQLGLINWLRGRLQPSRLFFDQAIASGEIAYLTHVFSALNYWQLGFPTRARADAFCGYQRAQRTGNPFLVAGVMANLARLNYFMGCPLQTKLWAQRTIVLAEAYEIPFWLSIGELFLGYALAQSGQIPFGVARAEAALARIKSTGHMAFRTHFESVLAQTYGFAQQYTQALTIIDDALALADQTGENHWRAELIRLRGEFLLQHTGAQEAAAACYKEAIAIAQEQTAKSLELRATISLCELPQDPAERALWLKRLAALYDWFDEGFRTLDLRKARALLSL